MKIIEKQNLATEVVVNVICDCCGEPCVVNIGKVHQEFEYMKLEADWGYGTKKDNERWSAQICEKCVDEKFSFIKFNKGEINYIPTID